MGKKKQAKREAKRGAKQLVDADIDVGHGVAAELHRHPVVKAAGALSEVADQPPMVAINLTTIAVGLIAQDRRLTRTGIRMLAAHGLATIVKAAIKHRIDRARPNQFSDREDHRPTPGDRDEGPQNSFPSGHTAGAIAVARAVAREYPGAAVPVQGGAVAIAAIQVPRGTHFPIDVAVGAVIGWAAEAIVARVMPAEQGAGRPSGRIPAQAGARLTEG